MRRMFVVACAFVLVVSACGKAKVGVQAGPPVTQQAAAFTYVAVGASESVGAGAASPLTDAWTKLVWQALPTNTTFVDVAVPGYTVQEAISSELPRVLALKPKIVTVWLNVNDIAEGVQPSQYKAQLLALLSGLQRTGARVFVANTPPVEQLPAFMAAGQGAQNNPFSNLHPLPTAAQMTAIVSDYNAAIAADAMATGAHLVDLGAAYSQASMASAASGGGGLIAADGFHPSTAGHKAVAQAFITAIQKVGLT